MNSSFASYSPNCLLDWDKILNGDYLDPFSGQTWTPHGTFIGESVLPNDTGGIFTGNQYIQIKDIPWSDEYTIAVVAIMDTIRAWGRIWESSTSTSGDESDISGLMTPPQAYAGIEYGV